MSDTEAFPDFSHVEKQKLDGKEAWFPIPCVAPGARVRGRSADPSTNLALTAADLELAAKEPGRTESTAQKFTRRIAEQGGLFAKHVLTGWVGVIDASGKEVEFSEVNARALMRALPSHVLASLLTFFTRPELFGVAIDAEAVAGNSPAGSSGS